jgi:hypothetical protein
LLIILLLSLSVPAVSSTPTFPAAPPKINQLSPHSQYSNETNEINYQLPTQLAAKDSRKTLQGKPLALTTQVHHF